MQQFIRERVGRLRAPLNIRKHKFLRWNEVSRRYVDDEPEFYYPDVWRRRSEDKKQGSGGALLDYESLWEFGTMNQDVRYHEDESVELYNWMISQKVAPEQARMVLPQNTMTEWWWSGSLDAFADMVNLRGKDDTQYETRLVAVDINREMTKLFPYSWKALTS